MNIYGKARVSITGNSPYGDYRKGQGGIVDGYVLGGDNTPCAVVILTDDRFVLVPIHSIIFVAYV